MTTTENLFDENNPNTQMEGVFVVVCELRTKSNDARNECEECSVSDDREYGGIDPQR